MPKREISEYVSAETGIHIPDFFDDIPQALSHVEHGGSVIIRDEHPDHYEGPSGLLISFVVSPGKMAGYRRAWAEYATAGVELDERAITMAALNLPTSAIGDHYALVAGILVSGETASHEDTVSRLNLFQANCTPQLRFYCNYAGKNQKEYLQDLSYSAAKLLPGTNLTVVADTARPKRWSIFGGREKDGSSAQSWSVVDDTERTYKTSANQFWSERDARRAVDNYEAVRHLPRFNPAHCPIQEWQLADDGTLSFLQLHRSRDASSSPFFLTPDDYREEEGWVAAEAVRGWLPESPLELTFGYASQFDKAIRLGQYLPSEEGLVSGGCSSAANEAYARHRKLVVSDRGKDNHYRNTADGHNIRSPWLKSQAALILPEGALASVVGQDALDRSGRILYRSQWGIARLAVQAVSDGRIGFMRANPAVEDIVSSFELQY